MPAFTRLRTRLALATTSAKAVVWGVLSLQLLILVGAASCSRFMVAGRSGQDMFVFDTYLVIEGCVSLLATGVALALLVRAHGSRLRAINASLEEEVGLRVGQLLRTRNAMIFGLAKLADFRDTDTGEHLDRICHYCTLLARELKKTEARITDDWIENLALASAMHDIGKVGVPDAILLKPGKFTPEERAEMEKHPNIGCDTLIAVRETMGEDALVEMSLRVALYHHERWDGNGYPMKMAGEAIPLEARIVALADVYDALTSKRVYKDAMPHAKAAAMIREGAGTQFDPAVVEAFSRIEAAFDEARERLQSPGMLPSDRHYITQTKVA